MKQLVIFALLNFGALAIGGLFTGGGVSSEWYASLNKAPWTPPGWVFGAAWTTIMVCFTIYMAKAFDATDNKSMIIGLFAVQWVLNVAWNPAFFKYHMVVFGLIILILLVTVLVVMAFKYSQSIKHWSWLIAPYIVWLLIATSLNGYILLSNR